MTWEADLEEAIAKTGVVRYRFLCSDENNMPEPNDRETWRQFMGVVARGEENLPNIDEHLVEAAGQDANIVRPCLPCPEPPLPP